MRRPLILIPIFPLISAKSLLRARIAAVYGYVDALIQPRDTLARMIAALDVLHGLAGRESTPQNSQKKSYTAGKFRQVLCGGRNRICGSYLMKRWDRQIPYPVGDLIETTNPHSSRGVYVNAESTAQSIPGFLSQE